jgi:hypothetical protein
MKKLWPLLLMVMPLQLVHSQEVNQKVEHALTVEQCRADMPLWQSKLHAPKWVRFRWNELDAMHDEMSKCLEVDVGPRGAVYHQWYFQTMSDITFEQRQWLLDFIDRHGLFSQFSVEILRER